MRKRPGVGDSGEGESMQQSDSGDGEVDSTTAVGIDMQPRAAAYGDYGFPQMYPQKGPPPPYMQAGQQMPAPYAQFQPQGPYFQQIGYPGQAPFLGPQYPPLVGGQQEKNIKQKEGASEAAVTPKKGKKKVKGKKTGESPPCLVIFVSLDIFFLSPTFFRKYFCFCSKL